jgi:hypothetical protein
LLTQFRYAGKQGIRQDPGTGSHGVQQQKENESVHDAVGMIRDRDGGTSLGDASQIPVVHSQTDIQKFQQAFRKSSTGSIPPCLIETVSQLIRNQDAVEHRFERYRPGPHNGREDRR